jgi:hypothetical protein
MAFSEDEWDDLAKRLIPAAHGLLENGPLTAAELAVGVRDGGVLGLGALDDESIGALTELVDEIMLDDDHVLFSGDGRIVLSRWLFGGVVFTHRVTAGELDRKVLDMVPDLDPLLFLFDSSIELVVGGSVELRFPFENEPHLDEHGSIEGPDGWLDGIEPDELIGVSVVDGRMELARGVDPASGEPEVDAIRALVDVLIEAGSAVEPHELVIEARLSDNGLFTQPTPPVAELLERAGLRVDGAWAGRSDDDFQPLGQPQREQLIEQLAGRYRLDGCCVEALERLLEIWNKQATSIVLALRDDTPIPDLVIDDEGELVDDLHHGAVASALADWVFDISGQPSPTLDAFVGQLLTIPSAEGPARYLRACNAILGGAALEALEDVRRAVDVDASFAPALALFGDLLADAGRLSEALSARRRELALGVAEPDIKMLESMLEPFAKAGRNERCPCGSGRKFKQCCIDEPKLSSQARRELALSRAVLSMHGGVGHRDQLFTAAISVLDAIGLDLEVDDAFADRIRQFAFDPFVADVAAFDSGGVDRYLECRGEVVPGAEREWLEYLRYQSRSLCEVESNGDGTYELRDAASGAVFAPVTLSQVPADGELLLGRVVDDSLTGRPGVVGPSLLVTVEDRPGLTELLAEDPNDQAWLEWYATRLTPPES